VSLGSRRTQFNCAKVQPRIVHARVHQNSVAISPHFLAACSQTLTKPFRRQLLQRQRRRQQQQQPQKAAQILSVVQLVMTSTLTMSHGTQPPQLLQVLAPVRRPSSWHRRIQQPATRARVTLLQPRLMLQQVRRRYQSHPGTSQRLCHEAGVPSRRAALLLNQPGQHKPHLPLHRSSNQQHCCKRSRMVVRASSSTPRVASR